MRQGNPFGERPAWRDWLAAIAIAGILLAIAIVSLSVVARHGDLSNLFLKEGSAPAAVAVVQPLAASPPAVKPSRPDVADAARGAPDATPAAQRGATRAWICERNGVREYSDRPCAAVPGTATTDGTASRDSAQDRDEGRALR